MSSNIKKVKKIVTEELYHYSDDYALDERKAIIDFMDVLSGWTPDRDLMIEVGALIGEIAYECECSLYKAKEYLMVALIIKLWRYK